MWAVMSSPLLMSSDILNISSMNLETYSNSKVIAVNQDDFGKQGIRVAGNDLTNIQKVKQGMPKY